MPEWDREPNLKEPVVELLSAPTWKTNAIILGVGFLALAVITWRFW